MTARPSQVRSIRGCSTVAAAATDVDGLPALTPSLPGCRRRYLLVDFAGVSPFAGPWRCDESTVDVIVLRGSVRLALEADEVTLHAGDQVAVPARSPYRLLLDAATLFELYLPPYVEYDLEGGRR